MITPNLMKMIGDAMKARDSIRVSTLRMLSSELKNEKINLQHDLSEEEELKVIRKEAKKRKEAIETYQKILNDKNANVKERLEQETQELAILQEFLPAEVTEEEVIQLINDSVNQLGAKTMADMGRVMADIKTKNPGVDGSMVAQLVRQKLEASN